MLTDKQVIALSLLKTTVNSASAIMYMARNVEGTRRVIRDALTVAELFLETSNTEPIPNEIINQLEVNNQKLQDINEALDTQYLESTSSN